MRLESSSNLLEARNITKRFPGTLALDDVHLELLPGEIHAVLGENGAGKSTLMKILAGVHSPDSGYIALEGQRIVLHSPREALMLGISIVHQELSIVPALTVAENIYPGRLLVNAFGMVRYGKLFQQAADVLSELELRVDPREIAGNLSIANQQLVEIAKALSWNCKVLILDEPTSALTEHEAEILFSLLRKLAESGVGIIYISHKLDEIFKLSDRITVLRDGKYITTVQKAETTPSEIVRLMVGRPLEALYPPKATQHGDPIFEVHNLRLTPASPENNLKVYNGEILGIAGLIGSGRTELARAIFGADARTSGNIKLHGKLLNIKSPQNAIRAGIGYLPEDRKAAGLFLNMAIKMNIEAASLQDVADVGFLNGGKERSLAEKYVQQLGVSTPGIEQEVRRLSGGNQQKTLIAKWLAIHPKVLIVDEPTRGVDVGAKSEIHYLLRSLANQGIGVIMISSELPEVLGMSDRILVMHEGVIAGEVSAANATEEHIMRIASGQGVAVS
jgi:ribose transport system ATP-binding protein